MKKITTTIVLLLFSIIINAQPSITTDSITQLTTCAGGNLLVTFKTTGTFPLGNTFTAQISNALGSFATPLNIGQTPFVFGQGLILATLPKTLSFGFFYKIRVISSNPADTSVSPSTIIISTIAQLNQIIKGCQGDSTTLTSTNLLASSYSWSTNATTTSIKPTTPGIYSVTTKDIAGCKSTVSDTIIGTVICAGTGIDENTVNNIFTIYPNPSNGFCNVAITNTNSKDVLITVMDILGKEVFCLSDKNSSAEYKKEINLEHLATGIYSIKLIIGSDVKTRKLIIQ